MSRAILIRAAQLEDLPALAKLEAAAFPDPWTLAALEEELRSAATFVRVATTMDSAISAAAFFRLGPGEAELLRLAVAPELRRAGLATFLVEAAFQQLAERGATTCFLEVRADNTPAIALYRRLGFEPTGRRARYYGDGGDAVLMARALDAR